nr:hypothetical protein [Bacteroidota bacterium]
MKSGINIFVFALLISFSPVLIAGQPDTNGTLQGYWLEYEGGGFSFTSLFVFEPSDQGNIDGKVYFFHDEASTKEFSLGRIKCTGDSLCFIISGSAIYFSGIIDKKGMSVRGSFILDDGTVVPVLHKKIDPDNYSTFPDVQKC